MSFDEFSNDFAGRYGQLPDPIRSRCLLSHIAGRVQLTSRGLDLDSTRHNSAKVFQTLLDSLVDTFQASTLRMQRELRHMRRSRGQSLLDFILTLDAKTGACQLLSPQQKLLMGGIKVPVVLNNLFGTHSKTELSFAAPRAPPGKVDQTLKPIILNYEETRNSHQ